MLRNALPVQLHHLECEAHEGMYAENEAIPCRTLRSHSLAGGEHSAESVSILESVAIVHEPKPKASRYWKDGAVTLEH